ncbi:Hypothetical predicted protein, partial [Mytilus galloprovincialis]
NVSNEYRVAEKGDSKVRLKFLLEETCSLCLLNIESDIFLFNYLHTAVRHTSNRFCPTRIEHERLCIYNFKSDLGGNQYWELTKDYELRHNYVCVVKRAKFKDCSPKERVQWDYLKDNRIQLKGSDLCLSATNNYTKVGLKVCSRSVKQLWIWKR